MNETTDNQFNQSDNNGENNSSDYIYPAKPIMIEKSGNSFIRSISSLVIYFILFYFLFERNIAYIAAILMVILIHEFGHLLAMKVFKYQNVKIFILPLIGALTSGKKQNISQLQLSIVILAGPIPGIIIACALYYFNLGLKNETLNMLANSFLFLNLFNLLPIFPLDGGRLFETLFFKQNHIIRLVFGIISIIILIILFAVSSPIMLIVPALMLIELFNEIKNEKIRKYLLSEKINLKQDYIDLTNKDYWLIRDCILFSFFKKYANIKPGVYSYSPIEPVIVQHVNNILQPNLKYDLTVLKKVLIVLLYLACFLVPLILLSSRI